MTLARKARHGAPRRWFDIAAFVGMALLGLLAACGSSMRSETGGTDIQLSVEPDTATPGDTVTLVLRNASPDTIGYNLCTSSLERRRGSDWQTLPSDRICTMELRLLDPGGSTRYPLDLPDTLSAGEYRFSTSVDRIGRGAERVATQAFTVRGN